MPGEVHTQDQILSGVLAQVTKKIDPGLAEEANGQMHRVLSGYGGGVVLTSWNEQHISRCHVDLLVRRHARIDFCPINYFDGMRQFCVPDAPSFASVNLHDQDVHEVPMWLECAAL